MFTIPSAARRDGFDKIEVRDGGVAELNSTTRQSRQITHEGAGLLLIGLAQAGDQPSGNATVPNGVITVQMPAQRFVDQSVALVQGGSVIQSGNTLTPAVTVPGDAAILPASAFVAGLPRLNVFPIFTTANGSNGALHLEALGITHIDPTLLEGWVCACNGRVSGNLDGNNNAAKADLHLEGNALNASEVTGILSALGEVATTPGILRLVGGTNASPQTQAATPAYIRFSVASGSSIPKDGSSFVSIPAYVDGDNAEHDYVLYFIDALDGGTAYTVPSGTDPVPVIINDGMTAQDVGNLIASTVESLLSAHVVVTENAGDQYTVNMTLQNTTPMGFTLSPSAGGALQALATESGTNAEFIAEFLALVAATWGISYNDINGNAAVVGDLY